MLSMITASISNAFSFPFPANSYPGKMWPGMTFTIGLDFFGSFFFLVSYVEERLRWPIQKPNKGRKKKAKG